MQKKQSLDIWKFSVLNVLIKMRKIPLFYPCYNWARKNRERAKLLKWEKNGKSFSPPHMVKQNVVLEYSKKYGLQTLVETGTYLGDMVEAMRGHFDLIYSIELDRDLYTQAQKRFKNAGNVNLIQGDSGTEIKKLIKELKTPTLFWLDSHYSGGITTKGTKETPICEELNIVLSELDLVYVILIDDARNFGKNPAYPSIENLNEFIGAKKPNLNIVVEDDIIRITPNP